MENRVNEPPVRPETAIALELMLYLSDFSMRTERQKESEQGTSNFNFMRPVKFIFNALYIFDRFSPAYTGLTV